MRRCQPCWQTNTKVTATEPDDEDEGAQPTIFASWAEEMDWMEHQQRSLELDVVDKRPVPTQDQAEAAPPQDAAALRRDDHARQATPEGEEWIVPPPHWRNRLEGNRLPRSLVDHISPQERSGRRVDRKFLFRAGEVEFRVHINKRDEITISQRPPK